MKTTLSGLILCGGQSSRMGEDKSLLNYHGKPQRIHLYEMLQPFCDDVYISCSRQQLQSIPESYNPIVDAEKYYGVGPMAGVLTAFEKFPERAFFVIGCDYPFVEKKHIQYLADERTGLDDAVCYCHQETMISEPLITIYEWSSYLKIRKCFQERNYSLRQYLDEANACMIFPENFDFLKSVDDIKTYQQTKELLIAKLN
jgi:molybdopterin-guanine dinucleotide biosynthesis protein A